MCFDEIAAPSAQIHQFQTMLMVGSLKCRNLDPTSLRRYGDFVTSRNGDLAVHSDNVREAFAARYGEVAGTRMFRIYETSLGNEFSRIDMTRASCQDLGTYARMAERADHADIATISGLATNRSVPFCPADYYEPEEEEYAPSPVAAVTPPPPVARRAVAAKPRPGPHEAEFVEVVEAPVVPIADETEYAVAEAELPEQPDAGADLAAREARLSQAIEALNNAANALREMQDGPATN
ncbi:hypothetical protein E3U23_07610 [Erythrobacter litoralis]|uniref:hypothetical protein n=1 Tax=Erythrobacter litoralis TaxID=39960 RepID=UPI0024354FB8|nr:hypothetical protein [Erythrobacter litoralis]MDG6079055.1 hypothetical protein [Erythrobacter litoralis]